MKRKYRLLIVYPSALIIFVLTMFPFYWMVTASVKPFKEILMEPTLVPNHMDLHQYILLFEQSQILVHLKNSFWTAGVATLVTLILAGMTGYAITRYDIVAGEFIARLTLFTYMVPSIVLILPLYLAMKTLGLINSHLGLIISYLTITLPFAIWMLRSYFATIPKTMEEASLIDGANRFEAFLYVVMPQAMPGFISTAIFVFIVCWGEYLYPLVIVSLDTMKTIPTTLASLVGGGQNINFGLLMAGSTVATLPILLIFLVLQKYLVAGFAAGGYE
jgi:multiple sugar transport system permease protein